MTLNQFFGVNGANGEPLRKFGDENFDALNEDDFIR